MHPLLRTKNITRLFGGIARDLWRVSCLMQRHCPRFPASFATFCAAPDCSLFVARRRWHGGATTSRAALPCVTSNCCRCALKVSFAVNRRPVGSASACRTNCIHTSTTGPTPLLGPGRSRLAAKREWDARQPRIWPAGALILIWPTPAVRELPISCRVTRGCGRRRLTKCLMFFRLHPNKP